MTIEADKLHYVRIPGGKGGRAEMVRMVYALAGRPYQDVLHDFTGARAAVEGKNPFKQFPFVETTDGRVLYQALAIMHHAAHGTPAWPSDPVALTRALSVAMGAYDLYQAFAGFRADDEAAKQKFEEKQAPKYFEALAEIYAGSAFACGNAPCFADCMVYEGVSWCVRRNERCAKLLENLAPLVAFRQRFEAFPAIAEFRARQAAAREQDDAV